MSNFMFDWEKAKKISRFLEIPEPGMNDNNKNWLEDCLLQLTAKQDRYFTIIYQYEYDGALETQDIFIEKSDGNIVSKSEIAAHITHYHCHDMDREIPHQILSIHEFKNKKDFEDYQR